MYAGTQQVESYQPGALTTPNLTLPPRNIKTIVVALLPIPNFILVYYINSAAVVPKLHRKGCSMYVCKYLGPAVSLTLLLLWRQNCVENL